MIDWESWRKKPVVINAIRVQKDGLNIHQLCTHPEIDTDGGRLQIKTREGELVAYPGDWIIQGVEDEVYPCNDAIFHKTYERV